jgi:pilus assembly protein Flp/PilA
MWARESRPSTWESIMQNHIERFVKDESGATAIEYGLIAALIAVGIIAAARGLGSQISATFNTVTSTMSSA